MKCPKTVLILISWDPLLAKSSVRFCLCLGSPFPWHITFLGGGDIINRKDTHISEVSDWDTSRVEHSAHRYSKRACRQPCNHTEKVVKTVEQLSKTHWDMCRAACSFDIRIAVNNPANNTLRKSLISNPQRVACIKTRKFPQIRLSRSCVLMWSDLKNAQYKIIALKYHLSLFTIICSLEKWHMDVSMITQKM